MTDRLQEFGHNFQIKSIVCLMKESTFIEQVADILDENHYDNDGLKFHFANHPLKTFQPLF